MEEYYLLLIEVGTKELLMNNDVSNYLLSTDLIQRKIVQYVCGIALKNPYCFQVLGSRIRDNYSSPPSMSTLA
jgi:hypothetical protein